jgi:hypothetical protein
MTKRKKVDKREVKEKKRAETLSRMKKNRYIDSDNLREIIKAKLAWIEVELKKGELHKKGLESQQDKLRTQMDRLEGMKIFIKDLLDPQEDIKE